MKIKICIIIIFKPLQTKLEFSKLTHTKLQIKGKGRHRYGTCSTSNLLKLSINPSNSKQACAWAGKLRAQHKLKGAPLRSGSVEGIYEPTNILCML